MKRGALWICLATAFVVGVVGLLGTCMRKLRAGSPAQSPLHLLPVRHAADERPRTGLQPAGSRSAAKGLTLCSPRKAGESNMASPVADKPLYRTAHGPGRLELFRRLFDAIRAVESSGDERPSATAAGRAGLTNARAPPGSTGVANLAIMTASCGTARSARE